MRITTWKRFCSVALICMFMAAVGMFIPESHWFHWVSGVATIFVIFAGCFGAFLGILFALGKLKFRCPECDGKAPVTDGGQKAMWLSCKKCGEIRVSMNGFRTKWEVVDFETEAED